jgi:hypothetical protein
MIAVGDRRGLLDKAPSANHDGRDLALTHSLFYRLPRDADERRGLGKIEQLRLW